MKNYYQILGVATTAEQEVITAAYKALAKLYHPDVNNSKNAQERMVEINEAYQVLSDSNRREKYNQEFNSSSSFSSGNESEAEGLAEVLADDWEVLISVFEDAEFYRRELFKLDQRLSVFYQLTLLTKKLGNKSKETFDVLAKAYLEEHFSSYKPLQELAVTGVTEGELKFVDDIRRKVAVLGDSAAQQIFKKAELEFIQLKMSRQEKEKKRAKTEAARKKAKEEAARKKAEAEVTRKKAKEELDRQRSIKKNWAKFQKRVDDLEAFFLAIRKEFGPKLSRGTKITPPIGKLNFTVDQEELEIFVEIFRPRQRLFSRDVNELELSITVYLAEKKYSCTYHRTDKTLLLDYDDEDSLYEKLRDRILSLNS